MELWGKSKSRQALFWSERFYRSTVVVRVSHIAGPLRSSTLFRVRACSLTRAPQILERRQRSGVSRNVVSGARNAFHSLSPSVFASMTVAAQIIHLGAAPRTPHSALVYEHVKSHRSPYALLMYFTGPSCDLQNLSPL